MEKTTAIFRPWRDDDRASLASHINNRKIWDNVRDYLPHPYTEKDAEEFIAHALSADPTVDYAVEVDGEAAGGIGIVPGRDVERVSAEIGYWLGEEHWGKGIMSSIVSEFSDHIFSSTDIVHLFAGIFGFNRASMRVLEKAGYVFAGVMHNAAVKNGRLTDMHYYEKVKL